MSIRERTWVTSKGEIRKALVADFRDQTGKRVLHTLRRKEPKCPCCGQLIIRQKETREK